MDRECELNDIDCILQQNKQQLLNIKVNSRFFVVSELGRGSFGIAYQAIDLKQQNMNVALKLLSKKKVRNSSRSEDEKALCLRYIEEEDKILRKFNHPNILPWNGTYENHDYKIIVTKLCDKQNLRVELQKRSCFYLDKAINVLTQICNAVAVILTLPQELHSKNVIHRDLKLENIFTRNGVYFLGDFGLSKTFYSEHNNTRCGSSYTQAPEVVTKKYGLNVPLQKTQADIYSIGVIFFVMLCSEGTIQQRAERARGINVNTISFVMKNGAQPCQEVISFLAKTLQRNPEKRMKLIDLVNCPIFKVKDRSRVSSLYFIKSNLQTKLLMDKPSVWAKSNNFVLQGETQQIKLCRVGKQEQQKLKEKAGIENEETKIFKRLNFFHLSAKKAQFILNQIIIPIERNGLLDLGRKTNIQVMYLLSSRCFINMSYANCQSYQIPSLMFATQVRHLKEDICLVYEKCKASFDHYSGLLTKHQNKPFERFADVFRKIIRNKSKEADMRILNGVEKLDYQTEDHLKQTQKRLDCIEQVNTKDIPLRHQMLAKFRAFRAVNQIELEQIEDRSFQDVVSAIIKSKL